MNKGFTVIELMVVIGTLAILSSILIINIHGGDQQIVVFKEQSKIISAIARAKSLAVATFSETSAAIPCGYGVHFEEPGTFFIFKDLADDCRTSDHVYSGLNEMYQSFDLDPSVYLEGTSVSDVLFIPPDPVVIITPDQKEATIEVKSRKDESSAAIKINSAGQISS